MIHDVTNSNLVGNIFCAKYQTYSSTEVYYGTQMGICEGKDGFLGINDSSIPSEKELKKSLQGVLLYYELAEPVEDIFEKPLNLTYTVINGGTETSLATENSTQFEGSIAYNKDYVAVVDELQMQNRVIQIEFENWEN